MAREEVFFGINIDTGDVIKDFGTLKKRTKELKKELDGTKVGTKRFEELKKEITANQATIRRFNRELRETKSLATRVGQGVTTAFKRVGGVLAATFAAGGLIEGVKSAVNTMKDFEQAIADVAAVSGASARQLALLEASARELGKTSIFTAEEVANLQLELAKLGFSSEEIVQASGGILDLATAFRIDLSQAASVTASTLRAFGLEASETERLTLLMADSFASTALDITKFEESMKLVAPAAKQTGRSVEEVTALLGLLANNGLSGSIAGTQLNRVFIELNKRGISLEDAMSRVANSTDKLGTATELVGDRGAKALSIFSDQSAALKELREDFQDTEEVTNLAKDSSDTLTGALKRLNSAWDELILSFSNSKGVIRDVVEGITDLFDTISKSRETDSLLEELGFEEGFVGTEAETQTIQNLLTLIENRQKLITDAVAKGNEKALMDLIKISKQQVGVIGETGKDLLDETGENAVAFKNAYLKIVKEANAALKDLEKTQSNVQSSGGFTIGEIVDPTEEDPFAFDEKVEEVDIDVEEEEVVTNRLGLLDRLTKSQDEATEEFIRQQEVQREQMRMTAEYEREMNNIRFSSASSLINSTIGLLSLDEDARKKNAKIIKTLAIAEVGVNLAQQLSNIASVNSSPSNLANLFTFGGAGLTATGLQSAAAVANAAVQVASIQSQKFAKGGILNGPSHAAGGIKTPFGEMEGGEAVINKKSTAMFKEELSAMNVLGGGKKFARGGVLGVPSTTNVPDTSSAEILSAISNIDMRPTVSVVEINDAQTRISEIENNSIL